MAMGKYRIKETNGGYIVLYLKDYGNGFSWEQIGRNKYESKEAAQAFIDAERGADNEKND